MFGYGDIVVLKSKQTNKQTNKQTKTINQPTTHPAINQSIFLSNTSCLLSLSTPEKIETFCPFPIPVMLNNVKMFLIFFLPLQLFDTLWKGNLQCLSSLTGLVPRAARVSAPRVRTRLPRMTCTQCLGRSWCSVLGSQTSHLPNATRPGDRKQSEVI